MKVSLDEISSNLTELKRHLHEHFELLEKISPGNSPSGRKSNSKQTNNVVNAQSQSLVVSQNNSPITESNMTNKILQSPRQLFLKNQSSTSIT